MARVVFGGQLLRQLQLGGDGAVDVGDAGTVGAALESAFGKLPQARGYVVDEQGRVRKHVAVFVDGKALADKTRLDAAVGAASEIFVLQALSGG